MNQTAPREWVVAPADRGCRLDSWLAAKLERSRAHAQRLIAAQAVAIAPLAKAVAPSLRLAPGQRVWLNPERAVAAANLPPALEPEARALDILFEDKDLLVLDKPPGLVVHPAAGHAAGTLVNALLHHCGNKLAARGGGERLGIVHRLDKETSGVMVVAKTDRAHERLAAQFAGRTVHKTYQALAWGSFHHASGECRGAIGRHRAQRKKMAVLPSGGRAAHTDYQVLEQFARAAQVECRLHTGRTHQIRVHLAHLGHPIVGDALYGRARPWPHTQPAPARQMLHAWRLAFAHPVTEKPLAFQAPLPADFLACRKILASESASRRHAP